MSMYGEMITRAGEFRAYARGVEGKWWLLSILGHGDLRPRMSFRAETRGEVEAMAGRLLALLNGEARHRREAEPITVRTAYLGPTDTRGSRIRAYADGRQLTLPYDYASTDPHQDAALALAGNIALARGTEAPTSARIARTGTRGYVWEVR